MSDIPFSLIPNESLAEQGYADQLPQEAALPVERTVASEISAPMPVEPQVAEVPHVNLESDDGQPLYDLYDHANKAVLKVPESELALAIKSGQYTLPKGQEVPVLSPDGTPGTIKAEKLSEALSNGFKIDALADRTERELQAKYGDSDLEAAAAGFARGSTFGLSDQLLTKTGLVSEERMREVQERNQEAAITGEVASLLTPTGLGGGVTKLGINAVEKLGVKAEQAAFKELSKAAAKLGPNSKYAQAIVAKIPSKGVGSAVEGSFYGAGQLLSEDALGKADFNAENLAAYAGTGALLGGAFGAGLSSAVEAIKPVGKFLGDRAEKLATNSLDKERASLELMGYSPAQISKLKDRNGKLVSELPEFLKTEIKLTKGDSAEDLMNKVEALNKESGEKIGAILEDVEQLGKQFPQINPDKRAVFGRIAEQLDSNFLAKYADSPGYSSQLKPIYELVQDFGKLSAKEGTSIKALHEMRKNVDALIRFEKAPGTLTLKENALLTARKLLNEEIDMIAQNATQIKGGESLSAALKRANKNYSYTAELADQIARKVDKEQIVKFSDVVLGGIGIGAGGLTGAAGAGAFKFLKSDYRRKLVILSEIEKAQQKVSSAINKAATGFLNTAKVIPRASSMNLSDSFMSHDLSEGRPKKAKSELNAYQNTVQNLETFSTNPESMIERSNRTTSAMFETAPETSAALDTVNVNAAAFLASKVPKRLQQPSAFSNLEQDRLPSKFEVSKFMRYVKGVEKPMDVIKELESGHVNREGIESIKTVYPNIFAQLQDSVLDSIQKSKVKIPYNKKIQLGILFDVPSDISMQPENISALQAPFIEQQQAQSASMTQTGLGKLEFGEKSKTGAEAIEDGAE